MCTIPRLVLRYELITSQILLHNDPHILFTSHDGFHAILSQIPSCGGAICNGASRSWRPRVYPRIEAAAVCLCVVCSHSAMSRRPQQPPIDTTQPEVEEEEALSGAEEGDEVMEDAQEQEDGYSALGFLFTVPPPPLLVLACHPHARECCV